MRDYAKIAPQFWTGTTGKRIRAHGRDAQVVALYLLTCPAANMIGLYYLPLPTLCHEVGIHPKGASKALRSLSEGGFAHYDEQTEHVFIPEMARFQIGSTLTQKDNRWKAIIKDLAAARSCSFIKDFYDRYAEAYQLPPTEIAKPLRRPFGGPSEPLRSQEQEQEQESPQSPPEGSPSKNGFREEAGKILLHLNSRAGRSFRPVDATLRPIEARLRSGATPEQCRAVIDAKARDWRGDPKMSKFLRPETLFNPTKFESYFAEATAPLPDDED